MGGQRTTSAPAHLTEIWLRARVSHFGSPHDTALLILTQLRPVSLNTQLAGTCPANSSANSCRSGDKMLLGEHEARLPLQWQHSPRAWRSLCSLTIEHYSRPSFIHRNSKVFQLFFPKAQTAGLDVLLQKKYWNAKDRDTTMPLLLLCCPDRLSASKNMSSASPASLAAQTYKFLIMTKFLSESVMTQQLPHALSVT